MKARILIVDDHVILRESLRLMLKANEEMEVVGEADDGRMTAEMAAKLKPNIVLMDISMPNLNGIDATKLIKADRPETEVLILSQHADKRFVLGAFKAGASGYVLKSASYEEIEQAIRVVLNGESYLSPKVAGVIIKDSVGGGGDDSTSPCFEKLTNKERELLQLISENKSSKEAARILHVSVKTVDARRRSIMKKLGVSGVANLTKLAIQEGMTSLDY